ncbi:hypothetical protein VXQ18_07430 [Brucella abortus]|nr:hypothetical protein [Brucella abortus]
MMRSRPCRKWRRKFCRRLPDRMDRLGLSGSLHQRHRLAGDDLRPQSAVFLDPRAI